MNNNEITINCVIVTYNRLKKLIKTLQCYDAQTLHPTSIIVVDNKSTDGTATYLKEWLESDSCYKKKVLTMSENLGGSAGFFEGIKAAMNNCDYVFVGDDDAYPCEDMLENIMYNINTNGPNISALCTKVVYPNGDIQYLHRRRFNKKIITIDDYNVSSEDYHKECFEVNTASFVGLCINCKDIKKIGLPEKDFFIQFDDTDFCYRLNKVGRILCIPKSVMIHDVEFGGEPPMDNWRNYYSFRNCLLTLKRNFPYRYFLVAFVRMYFGSFNPKYLNNKKYTQIRRDAARDAFNNKMGKCNKYLPG